MKKRYAILNATLALTMIVLLCVALTSCGFFGQLATIKYVSLCVGEGLESTNEGVVATVGTPFDLWLDWHNERIANPKIEWYISSGGQDEALSCTTKTLNYEFAREDVGKTYEFYGKVEGIKSETLKIKPVYAKLCAPVISSSTHDLVQNRIQQNRLSSEGMKNVTLTASWNKDYISPDVDVYVKWFVDGAAQIESGDTFTYDVSAVKSDCTVCVKAEIGYEYNGETVSESTEVTLVFLSDYELAQSVSITPVSNDASLKKVIDGTYYKKWSGTSENVVSFESTLLPDNANQNAKCVWSVRNGETEQKHNKTTRNADINLSQGKNVITATIDNVESDNIIVYVLSYDYSEDNAAMPEEISNAMKQRFVWKGDVCDTYISSQKDLNAYMGYAVSRHEIETKFEMYLAIDSWRNSETFGKKCSLAMQQGNDESGRFSYSMSVSKEQGTVVFREGTQFGIPSGAYENPDESYQTKVLLRYKENSQNRTELPVDSFEKSLDVYNSNDLYRAVSCGYKPVFKGADASKVQAVYQKAREVLQKYVAADMTEVEKVACIYDWIVYNVDYDHAVAELANSAGSSGYNAFYLEGVFNDNRAVCDGKSKAFVLLCGMEGIKAIRISGYANPNLSSLTDEQKAGCGHAWNKVLVDANGDGVREWYVVDTTWGDAAVKTKTGAWDEYLTYSYFLRTDADIASTHESSLEQPVADSVYNTYKNTFVTVGTKKIGLYVETTAQLNELLAYSKANGGICLSVYIVKSARGNENFGHLTPTRDGEYVIFGQSSLSF